MKKLSLNLDTLAVESFNTNETMREQGTVDAHQFGGGGSAKGTCLSCPVQTDPCLCDPVRTLTELGC